MEVEGTATRLSIVRDWARYVGEHLNGSFRLAIALAAAAMIVVPTVIAYQRRDDLTWSGDSPLLVTGISSLVIFDIDYTTASRTRCGPRPVQRARRTHFESRAPRRA